MSRRDPFVGFGDATNSSIKFQVVSDGGTVADWAGGPRMRQLEVANSDRTITQVHGRNPWEITLRLLLDSATELELLDGVQGQRATLRILAGTTRTAGGTVETLLGIRYLKLPETLLMEVGEVMRYPSGQRTAEATFQRAGVSSTYIGFADTGEDL